MKFTINITDEREEEVIVYAARHSRLTDRLRELIEEYSCEIIGYSDGETKRLFVPDVELFTVRDGKVVAIAGGRQYTVRERLYTLEEKLGAGFVRINQSSLANVSKIERFYASFGGSLCVVFKCGERDYVSRRQNKAVKTAIKQYNESEDKHE